ncbi:MAG: DUF1573 domain-containing protein, partial [Candidatus Omnitrophota bacterium]
AAIAAAIFITAAAIAAPKAFVEPETINLGILKEGKVFDFSFALFNQGNADLTINSVYAPCGCVKIVAPKAKLTLAPGQKTDIRYTFDSTGLGGEIVKYIYIYNNDPANNPVKITLKAQMERSQTAMVERFSSFKLLAVLSAGLVDGVNPCAFTVLVFFISFLTFVGYHRRQILILGSFFILAVFITYILIGVGLFEFFYRLEAFYIISHIVYIITAVIVLVLAVINLYDYWVFKKTGDPEKTKLKLPDMVKQRIHKVIRQETDVRSKPGLSASRLKLALAALSSGFIVSILESICTGQMYLPTIIYVLGFTKFKLRALSLLLLYNLMFILPLVAVFALGLLGMTSQKFAALASRHLAKVKIITAAVFFGLGIGLLLIIKR